MDTSIDSREKRGTKEWGLMKTSRMFQEIRQITGVLMFCICILLVALPSQALDLDARDVPVIHTGDIQRGSGNGSWYCHRSPPGGSYGLGYRIQLPAISNIQVNADNTYSYQMTSADTENLASGQYLVIIQHPMMNGQFDIVYDPSTGNVINRQIGSGTVIFQLGKTGSLQSPGCCICPHAGDRQPEC